jgi:hypothetical protein
MGFPLVEVVNSEVLLLRNTKYIDINVNNETRIIMLVTMTGTRFSSIEYVSMNVVPIVLITKKKGDIWSTFFKLYVCIIWGTNVIESMKPPM